MADTDSLKKSVQMEVDALMPQLKKLKDEIGQNPELRARKR